MIDLKKAQDIAVKSVTQAGNFLKQYQQDVLINKFKDSVDIQTDADLKAEKICLNYINQAFPDHNIFSEEAGFIDKQSDFTWVIDPLDGTKEYLRGMTTFSSLISLESKKELIAGACYFPCTQEIYSAAKNLKAMFNLRKIKVSKQVKLNQSLILTHPPNHKLDNQNFKKVWNTLGKLTKKVYRLRSTWYDAWCICQMATGAFEGYVLLHNQGPKWHDLSAAIIIAKTAGSKITDRFGKPIKLGDLKNGIVISNSHIHNQLLSIINH